MYVLCFIFCSGGHHLYMNVNSIRFRNGSLVVPEHIIVPVIPGDGVGTELWMATQPVVEAAIYASYGDNRSIKWTILDAGKDAFNRTGDWLPQETIDHIQAHLIALKGPLETPVGGGIRSINVQLRKVFDLYACVRPIRWFPGVPSPVKSPEMVDIVVFRENTEDTYCGVEWDIDHPDHPRLMNFLRDTLKVTDIRFPQSSSIGLKPISREGTERLFESAFQYAKQMERSSITIIHKGNIMKYTEGRFRDWGYDYLETHHSDHVFTWKHYIELSNQEGSERADDALCIAKEAGKIIVNDCIADAFFQQALLQPGSFSIVVATNLNGDYISDALAAQVGGIGISPGANINYHTGQAIFEATHGTAPSLAGKNRANPCAMILSVVMMLDYIGWYEPARLIESSIQYLIRRKIVTSDFQMPNATVLTTSEFSQRIIEIINR